MLTSLAPETHNPLVRFLNLLLWQKEIENGNRRDAFNSAIAILGTSTGSGWWLVRGRDMAKVKREPKRRRQHVRCPSVTVQLGTMSAIGTP